MRILIKTFSARGASIADEDGRIITGCDCREIVEAMRLLAPFTGCADVESYMRWTLRSIKGAGGATPEIEGDTPEARSESFLALLGENGAGRVSARPTDHSPRRQPRLQGAGDHPQGRTGRDRSCASGRPHEHARLPSRHPPGPRGRPARRRRLDHEPCFIIQRRALSGLRSRFHRKGGLIFCADR